MHPRWKLKESVRKLRSAGLSYKEIKAVVPVSKGTISKWCEDIELSEQQRCRLGRKYDVQLRGAKAVQAKRKSEVDKIINNARGDVRFLKVSDLKVIGLMLYWAEGNKTVFPGITNSDPDIIKIVMRWFREICGVEDGKFKAHLHIHSGQDETSIKKYWSSITGISTERFGKSHVKKEGSGHRKNKLYNGTIKINIFDKNLLFKILGWIGGVKTFISSQEWGASSMVEQQTQVQRVPAIAR
ncbi:MAG: hypothetical protein HYT75_08690 [Deltaproteobacteria bacterium]|nr:hypothetical protein [Deltaproteobacteria bacterium]